MVDGLKFIKDGKGTLSVRADDDDTLPFDTEDDFNDSALKYEADGYSCYYFGDGDDGSMKTNKTSIDIDGDRYNFYFEKSGSKKGAGLTGEKDDKYYQSGKLLAAGKDEKYQVVQKVEVKDENDNTKVVEKGYKKLADVDEVKDAMKDKIEDLTAKTPAEKEAALKKVDVNKKGEDIKDLYIINDSKGLSANEFFLVNTSGKVIDSKTKSKDGNDFVFVTKKGGEILAIYSED